MNIETEVRTASLMLNGRKLLEGERSAMEEAFSRLSGEWFHNPANQRHSLANEWGAAGHCSYLQEMEEALKQRLKGDLKLMQGERILAQVEL